MMTRLISALPVGAMFMQKLPKLISALPVGAMFTWRSYQKLSLHFQLVPCADTRGTDYYLFTVSFNVVTVIKQGDK
jgi:hypothetical protein